MGVIPFSAIGNIYRLLAGIPIPAIGRKRQGKEGIPIPAIGRKRRERREFPYRRLEGKGGKGGNSHTGDSKQSPVFGMGEFGMEGNVMGGKGKTIFDKGEFGMGEFGRKRGGGKCWKKGNVNGKCWK